MSPIYSKSVRMLMRDMVSDFGLKPGEIITRERVRNWFMQKYPLIKEGTVSAHLILMSTNAPSRIHHSPKADPDDLFFRIDPSHFRLYELGKDPQPIGTGSDNGNSYKSDNSETPVEAAEDQEDNESVSEFAYERDLRNFLSKNLGIIEPGLRLYEEEGITGVEFPAGGRFIDILGIDKENRYTVIELKVSRGYDRVVGQILRYMTWIKRNQAEAGQAVRGVIIAREISKDLILACADQPNVQLFEYGLSVSLKRVGVTD